LNPAGAIVLKLVLASGLARIVVVVILVLVVSLFLMPATAANDGVHVEFPGWDLPARIVLAFAAAITVALAVQGASLIAGRRLGLA
jgi:hypothetical protein